MHEISVHRVNTPEHIQRLTKLKLPQGWKLGIEADFTNLGIAHPPFVQSKIRHGKGSTVDDFLQALSQASHIQVLTLDLKTSKPEIATLRCIAKEVSAMGKTLRIASYKRQALRRVHEAQIPGVILQQMLWMLPGHELWQSKLYFKLGLIEEGVQELATWLPTFNEDAQALVDFIESKGLHYFPGGIKNTLHWLHLRALAPNSRGVLKGGYLDDEDLPLL